MKKPASLWRGHPNAGLGCLLLPHQQRKIFQGGVVMASRQYEFLDKTGETWYHIVEGMCPGIWDLIINSLVRGNQCTVIIYTQSQASGQRLGIELTHLKSVTNLTSYVDKECEEWALVATTPWNWVTVRFNTKTRHGRLRFLTKEEERVCTTLME